MQGGRCTAGVSLLPQTLLPQGKSYRSACLHCPCMHETRIIHMTVAARVIFTHSVGTMLTCLSNGLSSQMNKRLTAKVLRDTCPLPEQAPPHMTSCCVTLPTNSIMKLQAVYVRVGFLSDDHLRWATVHYSR